jgi:type IV pilus assembly protein PilV
VLSQRGISLIESLVAIVVLALGISGLALVQARMLVASRAATGHAIALALADDLTNRMMFNAETARANGYALGWNEQPAGGDCSSAPCSGASLARADLQAWRSMVVSALPSGNATVFRSPADAGQVGIAIAWAMNEDARADADQAKYRKPFAVTAASHGIDCPVDSLCHVIYVRP